MPDDKKLFNSTVTGNIAIRPRIYRLSLKLQDHAAAAFASAQPGKFAELQLSNVALPPAENLPADLLDLSQRNIILRRPFSFRSIESASQTETNVDIVYSVLGPATLRMTTLAKGDKISIIGPLGNGFSVPAAKKLAIFIAGGIGAPPLLHLADSLKANYPDIRTIVFAGAKNIDGLPFAIEKLCEQTELHISTDDGSIGFAGFITDLADSQLAKIPLTAEEAVIYACGPEPMLAQTQKLAAKHNIDAQMSMERRMGCGIGICQSCAVEVKTADPNDTIYKLCCKDGPIFDSKEIVF